MGRRLAPLALSEEERLELKAFTMRRKTAQAPALRARIVLACAEGRQNKEVAASLGLDDVTVGKWRRRFVERSLFGKPVSTFPDHALIASALGAVHSM